MRSKTARSDSWGRRDSSSSIVKRRRTAVSRACHHTIEPLEARVLLSATVIDPTAVGQSSNISLTSGAQTYIYGEETGGEEPCGPFANGSGETVEDTNGVVAAGLAVTTQPTNSFTTNASYYTISGVGVSGYTNMQALYGQYVVSGAGEENSGSYEASVSFNLSQSALVVVMGLGSSQQEISFQGPNGLVTDAAVSGSGNGIPITAGIAHVNLGAGNYTIQETTSVTSDGQTLDNMVDLLGVYIFTGSGAGSGPSTVVAVPPAGTPSTVLTGTIVDNLGNVPSVSNPNEALLAVNNTLDLWVPFSYTTSVSSMDVQPYQDAADINPTLYSLQVLPPNGTWQFTATFISQADSISIVPEGAATSETSYKAATLLNLAELLPNLISFVTGPEGTGDIAATVLGIPTTAGQFLTLIADLENNNLDTPAPAGFTEAEQVLTAAASNPAEMVLAAPIAASDIASVFTNQNQLTQLANIIANATQNTPSTILKKIPEIAIGSQLESAVIYLGTELVKLYGELTTGSTIPGTAVFTAVSAAQVPIAGDVSSTTADISWQGVPISTGETATYTVCYDGPGDWWPNSVSTSNSSEVLGNLTPGTKYTFWVIETLSADGGSYNLALGSDTFTTLGTAPVSVLSISLPSQTITAGVPFSLTVDIEDQNGDLLTNDNSNVTIALSPDPILYGTTTVAAVNGVATFDNLYLNTSGNFSFVASDAADGLSASTPSSPVTITPAPAAKLAFIQNPTNATAGNAITPDVSVAIEDQYGNIVTTNNSRINLNLLGGPFGAFLLGQANIQVQNGVATFNGLSILKASDYSLEATDRGLASATSSPFAVTPGPAVQMLFVNQFPWLDSSGNTFNVQVALYDKYGNLATNDLSSVTLTLGARPKNGELTGDVTATVVNGIASFDDLSLNEDGWYSLVATDSNGIPSISLPLFYFNRDDFWPV
jgi:hypothetical protein